MKPQYHFIISGVAGAGVYGITKSSSLAATTFASGFLVDLDHVIDYLKQYPTNYSIRHFYDACVQLKLDKVILFLHSIEILLPLALVSYYTRSTWILGFSLGLALHLISDHIGNDIYHPATYFFTYRLRQGFKLDRTFNNTKG